MTSKLLILFFALAAASASFAAPTEPFENSAANLMVVLRETIGETQRDERLVPMGKTKSRLADGREVEMDGAWYGYIGNLHLRFVFDTPAAMPNASAGDLKRLGLAPEAALQLAIANIRRVYGAPKVRPSHGLMEVYGESPDLISSYFLDRPFWLGLSTQHPEGIVAMVVKRGSLLYSPLSNTKAVDRMRKLVAPLYSTSEWLRVSSALYLFKDGKWSVFQAPVKQ